MIPVHAAIGSMYWQLDHVLATLTRIVILILRFYAMFSGRKSLLYTLLALLGAQIVAEIVIVEKTIVHNTGKQERS